MRVVVLASGDERVFSSGGNLKAFADDSPVISKYAGLDRFPRLYQLLGGLGKPSLCAARGDGRPDRAADPVLATPAGRVQKMTEVDEAVAAWTSGASVRGIT